MSARTVLDLLAGLVNTKTALTTSSNSRRDTETPHRSAVTIADVIPAPATPTASDVIETGATLAASPMHFAVAAINEHGVTTATLDAGTVTPTVNHGLLIPIAQSVGAVRYAIFLGTPANPLWVGEIMEADRALGDKCIKTVGVVTTRSSATVVGSIVIGIVGTGVANNAAPFAFNNAFTPAAAVAGGVVPVNVDGCNGVQVRIRLAPGDFRSNPNITTVYFRQSLLDSTKWIRMNATGWNPLNAVGNTLDQEASLTTQGATALIVLVGTLTGQVPSVDIWVNPVK